MLQHKSRRNPSPNPQNQHRAHRFLPALLTSAVVGLGLWAASPTVSWANHHQKNEAKAPEALNFTVKTIQDEDKHLGAYAGKVVMVVNVASKCGQTKQYEALEKLYQTYKDQGLVILGFPANNYGGQEPGSNLQILEFCTGEYDVNFDMFAKISAKGDDIAPFLDYLTDHAPDDGKGKDIRWNFEKFLIDREGNVAHRFRTKVQPMDTDVIAAVETAIKG